MQWKIPIAFIAGIGIDHVLAYHHHHNRLHGHHAHGFQYGKYIEQRDLNWIDAQRVPEDMIVEIVTMTMTVFEECEMATTEIFEDTFAAPTNAPDIPSSTQPEPSKVETVTLSFKSEPTNLMTINMKPTSTKEKTHTPVVAEQITTINMTTTITTISTDSVTVSISIVAPPSANISIGTKSIEHEHAPPAPSAPQLLPSLPPLSQLLQDGPKDVVSQLPVPVSVPDLDQVLSPGGPAVPSNLEWTSLPANGDFSTKGFGGRSSPKGTKIKYVGNVGIPWGSNIIGVSPTEAHQYKYVAKFTGSNTEPWTVIVWNKIGPDDKMDGWYGHSALTFILAPGETRYIAFDEDSEGAWGAAPGTNGLPKDNWGGYTSTWGEYSFGDIENNGWSGWDVSAIQAQIAHQDVQGMRICMADGQGCSIITPNATKVVNAYTESKRHHDGIGGAAAPGPVRLVVDLDYKE